MKAKFSRFAVHEPPKTDTLDTTANEEMDNHTERVSQSARDAARFRIFRETELVVETTYRIAKASLLI